MALSLVEEVSRLRARAAADTNAAQFERTGNPWWLEDRKSGKFTNSEKYAGFPKPQGRYIPARPEFRDCPIMLKELSADMEKRKVQRDNLEKIRQAHRLHAVAIAPILEPVRSVRNLPVAPIHAEQQAKEPTYAEIRDKLATEAKVLQAEARAVVVAHAAKKFAEMAAEYHKALNPA